jgi:carbamate kinase
LFAARLAEGCSFVLATGQRAVIGSPARIEEMLAGTAGTQVCTQEAGGTDTL